MTLFISPSWFNAFLSFHMTSWWDILFLSIFTTDMFLYISPIDKSVSGNISSLYVGHSCSEPSFDSLCSCEQIFAQNPNGSNAIKSSVV